MPLIPKFQIPNGLSSAPMHGCPHVNSDPPAFAEEAAPPKPEVSEYSSWPGSTDGSLDWRELEHFYSGKASSPIQQATISQSSPNRKTATQIMGFWLSRSLYHPPTNLIVFIEGLLYCSSSIWFLSRFLRTVVWKSGPRYGS